MVFAFAKTLGGFRGRAAFARRCGLGPLTSQLQTVRAQAAEAVRETFDAHVYQFPEAVKRLTGTARPRLTVVVPVFCRCRADVDEFGTTLAALSPQSLQPDVVSWSTMRRQRTSRPQFRRGHITRVSL